MREEGYARKCRGSLRVRGTEAERGVPGVVAGLWAAWGRARAPVPVPAGALEDGWAVGEDVK